MRYDTAIKILERCEQEMDAMTAGLKENGYCVCAIFTGTDAAA